ncbi:MAG: hypothetical protein EXR99_07500 [Gemmataceae bacterium]|nr:hypothetical protein [Gemmataceae bacterium]
MEIEKLSLRIDEDPLNQLVAGRLAAIPNLKELAIRFEPGVAWLKGKYFALLYPVGFQVAFTPRLLNQKIELSMDNLSISGMPASLFKNMLVEFLQDQLGGIHGVTVSDRGITIDPGALLEKEGIPLKGEIRSLAIEKGFARLEAGPA